MADIADESTHRGRLEIQSLVRSVFSIRHSPAYKRLAPEYADVLAIVEGMLEKEPSKRWSPSQALQAVERVARDRHVPVPAGSHHTVTVMCSLTFDIPIPKASFARSRSTSHLPTLHLLLHHVASTTSAFEAGPAPCNIRGHWRQQGPGLCPGQRRTTRPEASAQIAVHMFLPRCVCGMWHGFGRASTMGSNAIVVEAHGDLCSDLFLRPRTRCQGSLVVVRASALPPCLGEVISSGVSVRQQR